METRAGPLKLSIKLIKFLARKFTKNDLNRALRPRAGDDLMIPGKRSPWTSAMGVQMAPLATLERAGRFPTPTSSGDGDPLLQAPLHGLRTHSSLPAR